MCCSLCALVLLLSVVCPFLASIEAWRARELHWAISSACPFFCWLLPSALKQLGRQRQGYTKPDTVGNALGFQTGLLLDVTKTNALSLFVGVGRDRRGEDGVPDPYRPWVVFTAVIGISEPKRTGLASLLVLLCCAIVYFYMYI